MAPRELDTAGQRPPVDRLAPGEDPRGDRYKWSARLEVINLTNNFALYNFLSTFSGTHYVTPRTITAEIGFHF